MPLSGFQPGPYSILFGRGKKCTKAPGRRRLRVIVSVLIQCYAKAKTKDAKLEIVSEIPRSPRRLYSV
jgi:hypothetical protein